MTKHSFIRQHKDLLGDYIRMSRLAGLRSDYVQGGGGNTSVKLDDRLMAVKASGYRLDQVSEADAYAVLDYKAISDFYRQTDPASLDDVEKSGSAKAKESVQAIPELSVLRPSVEAGFHSLLNRFVLHTHPVYANLAACCMNGSEIAAKALKGLDSSHTYIDYINPGAQLTFSIKAAMDKTREATGKAPAIIFLRNHGLIVTCGNADDCLALHDEVNSRIATAFGISSSDWPDPSVETAGQPDTWRSSTPWLNKRLAGDGWEPDDFLSRALYPDQLVFLGGQIEFEQTGSMTDCLNSGRKLPGKCTIFGQTGEVFYQCSANEARTIEQTLCAILFIRETVRKAGEQICSLDQAGSDFIKNWESEKYRKGIASK